MVLCLTGNEFLNPNLWIFEDIYRLRQINGRVETIEIMIEFDEIKNG